MGTLNVELDRELLGRIEKLALHQYGNFDEVSVRRIAEVALAMRLLWEYLVNGGADEIGEPIINWEFENINSGNQLPGDITKWLFKRR